MKAPYYIIALLEVHTQPETTATESTIAELVRDELIHQTPSGEWVTTSRGQAYAKLLGDCPLPEQRWIDPRSPR